MFLATEHICQLHYVTHVGRNISVIRRSLKAPFQFPSNIREESYTYHIFIGAILLVSVIIQCMSVIFLNVFLNLPILNNSLLPRVLNVIPVFTSSYVFQRSRAFTLHVPYLSSLAEPLTSLSPQVVRSLRPRREHSRWCISPVLDEC